MRKTVFLATGVALLSASAFAADMKAPTIYGKISKEYRYISQDQKSTNPGATDMRKATGVVDVTSSETRLGAKGTYETELANFDYMLELGLRTASTAANADGEGENIRIRQSNITAKGMFGSFTVGRQFPVGSAEILSYDPMVGTGLQASETDTDAIKNAGGTATNGGLGYAYESREEAITYRTPEFYGFQYGISSWHNRDLNDLDAVNAQNSALSHMIGYNNTFGGVDVKAMFNYVMMENEGQVSDKEDSYYNAAFAATYNNLTFSFIKSVYNEGQECVNTAGAVQGGPCDATFKLSDVDNNVEKMLVGLKYRMNDFTFMFSYATATDEDSDEGSVVAAATTARPSEAEYTQMAIGAGYDFNKNVTAKILVAKYEIDLPDAPAPAVSRDNEATSIIGHVTLQF